MGEWTKEQWTANDDECDTHAAFHSDQFGHCIAMDAADYARALACVNAMRGIPDPAKFVVDMQLAFQALRRGPELNLSNYTADDVAELNANATEAYLLMRPYLEAVIAKQALAAKPEESK